MPRSPVPGCTVEWCRLPRLCACRWRVMTGTPASSTVCCRDTPRTQAQYTRREGRAASTSCGATGSMLRTAASRETYRACVRAPRSPFRMRSAASEPARWASWLRLTWRRTGPAPPITGRRVLSSGFSHKTREASGGARRRRDHRPKLPAGRVRKHDVGRSPPPLAESASRSWTLLSPARAGSVSAQRTRAASPSRRAASSSQLPTIVGF